MLRAALALSAVALLWTALAYLAFALFTWFAQMTGTAGAAAAVAAIIFAVLALAALIFFATSRPIAADAQALFTPKTQLGVDNSSMTALLTQLAKDHPLIAIGCATALGVAQSMQAPNGRSRS
jgi:hypothetical protein